MNETKIIVSIDENGAIAAETKGFKGDLCVKELEELFKGIAEIDELEHTDDYKKKEYISDTIKNTNKLG